MLVPWKKTTVLNLNLVLVRETYFGSSQVGLDADFSEKLQEEQPVLAGDFK